MKSLALTPHRLRVFMRDVEKAAGATGCWLWVPPKTSSGYGSFCGVPAYRVIYEWTVRQIPTGMHLDHLCRNKACVNPHHLEPVAKGENNRRGRMHGPWPLRVYCRAGHAMTRDNSTVREWRGSRRPYVKCVQCLRDRDVRAYERRRHV